METMDFETRKNMQTYLAKLRIDKPMPRELRCRYRTAHNAYYRAVSDSDGSAHYSRVIRYYYGIREACATYAAEIGVDLNGEDEPIDQAELAAAREMTLRVPIGGKADDE